MGAWRSDARTECLGPPHGARVRKKYEWSVAAGDTGAGGRSAPGPVTGRVQSHALECIDVTYRDVASSSVVHSGA